VHLLSAQSFELFRCHPAQIRAVLKQEPLPMTTEYDLWSVGLILFELVFGLDLQTHLVSRIGNLALENVAQHYETFLQNTAPLVSYARFCFPNLLNAGGPLQLRVNELMCLCMRAAELDIETSKVFEMIATNDLVCGLQEKEPERWTRFASPFASRVAEMSHRPERVGWELEFATLDNKLTQKGLIALSAKIKSVFSKTEAPLADVVALVLTMLYPETEKREKIAKSMGVEIGSASKLWLTETVILALNAVSKSDESVCNLSIVSPAEDLSKLIKKYKK